MSATLTSTPVIDALMAAISCLSTEEKEVLVERVHHQMDMEENIPQWQMDIVDERLRSLENSTAKLIPMEEVFAELDAKWGARS
jgi:phage pi2 protein 07